MSAMLYDRPVMPSITFCEWSLELPLMVRDRYGFSVSRSVMVLDFSVRVCEGGGGVQISTPKHFNIPFKSCFTKANSAIVLILQTININNFTTQSTVLLCLCVPTSSCIKNFYCLFF